MGRVYFSASSNKGAKKRRNIKKVTEARKIDEK